MFRKVLILSIGVLGPLFWISFDMGLRWTALQRYCFPAYFTFLPPHRPVRVATRSYRFSTRTGGE